MKVTQNIYKLINPDLIFDLYNNYYIYQQELYQTLSNIFTITYDFTKKLSVAY